MFPVRFEKTAEVIYGFFDASGTGLGSMMQGNDEGNVIIRIGVWSTSVSNEMSSNWREFSNLVEGVKEAAEKGRLNNALLFLFTDNSTVEGAVAKGNSPSQLLFDLVIELKRTELKYGFVTHVVHISGKRMIHQGTDGASRGETQYPKVLVQPLRLSAPIHLSAFDRSPTLKDWIISWTGNKSLFLTPSQWFFEAHDLRTDSSNSVGYSYSSPTTYIWSPPPCIANVALEQLRYARLKRQDSLHIFVIPKLFVTLWRRQLFKAMDFFVTLPPSLPVWPELMFEPLILGFCFPFIRYKPWCIKGTPKLCATERKLQKMWKEEGVDGRDYLRQFLLEIRKLPSVPEHVVRSLLYFE